MQLYTYVQWNCLDQTTIHHISLHLQSHTIIISSVDHPGINKDDLNDKEETRSDNILISPSHHSSFHRNSKITQGRTNLLFYTKGLNLVRVCVSINVCVYVVSNYIRINQQQFIRSPSLSVILIHSSLLSLCSVVLYMVHNNVSFFPPLIFPQSFLH